MQFRKGCKFWWIILPTVFLDRISKHAVLSLLGPYGVKNAVPGLLSWAYTENRGAAFSLLYGSGIMLVILTLVLIAGLFLYLLRHTEILNLERCGLWLIIGGGLGNLWDRLVYGFVVDFIRLDFVNFAVFNAADVFVCTGAALVVLSVLISEMRRKKHG